MELVYQFTQTWVIILFALSVSLAFIITAFLNCGLADSIFMECSTVCFSAVSIIGGLKLSIISFLITYNEMNPVVDMNLFYSVYGGIAVVIVSLRTIKSKFNNIKLNLNKASQ